MATDSNKIAKYTVLVDTDTGKVNIQGLTKGFKDADVAFKKLQDSTKEVTEKGLNPLINKSGLAGAAVQEMGRTISDSNYGIQGMANNLSQLGSLFTNLITTTGGFTNALKAMWSALKGPLGIIIVFQTLLTLYEGYDMKARRAASETKKLTDSVGSAAAELRIFKEQMEDSNLSLVEKRELLEKVNDEYKTGNLELDEYGRLTQESIDKTDDVIESLTKIAQAKIFLNKIVEAENELTEAQAKTLTDTEKIYDRVTAIISSPFSIAGQQMARANIAQGRLDTEITLARQKVEKLKEDFKNTDLLSYLFTKGGGGDDTEPRDKIDKVVALLVGTTNEQDEAKSKAVIALRKMTEEMLLESNKDTQDAINNLHAEGGTGVDLSKYLEQVRQERIADLQMYVDQVGMVMDGLADFFDADFERQITMEQNKTNALNNELNLRLQNEKLSAEERASIQNQIYQNDEKLRKRQEQIEEKRFKMNKAANIANAVINTFLAATGVLAQTNGGPIARIVAMTAVISAGLLQVAAIAKQKFQTSASSAPPSLGGSAGGSSGQQAPDFNIVGSSGVNQLRTAIEGQLNRPIKTYVTTKDVSTGQELDRNIVQGATFGN